MEECWNGKAMLERESRAEMDKAVLEWQRSAKLQSSAGTPPIPPRAQDQQLTGHGANQ
jgi:hypothetical protein